MHHYIGKIMAAVTLCVTWSFSAENDSVPSLDLLMSQVDSSAVPATDSAVSPVADSTAATDSPVASADSAAMASAATPVDSVNSPADSAHALADSAHPVEAAPAASATPAAPLKTVLYLGGGERSPWFHLGVLYAIEEYAIPVDSIVATSWGAWIGALWAKGVPLDDIQKRMLDSAIAPFVGYDLSSPDNRLGYSDVDRFEQPISVKGKPTIRQRFTLSVDSAGSVRREKHPLLPDSSQVVRALAKLRFQESLYRERGSYRIPFVVQGCKDGRPAVVGNTVKEVIASLPLWRSPSENAAEPVSGELCPYQALPVEDNLTELPIVVVSDPLRQEFKGDTRSVLLKQHASDVIASQPGVVVRAHTILDTARTAWIQAGFTAFEKHLSDFNVLNGRRADYSTDRKAALPWFRFEPTFDSLSAEVHNAAKAHWDETDTGFVAPSNFAYDVLQNPAFDTLDFSMQPGGDLLVDAAVHPTFDVAVGGFGSNALGPHAYAEATAYYVNQMEIELVLGGFWGQNSYGVQPRLNVSKLWNRHWSVEFGYDYLSLSPLKSHNNKIARSLRIEKEERSDFNMSLVYGVDAYQKVSVEFLLGHRTYELDSLVYGGMKVKTYPVSPMLHYQILKGPDDNWFAENGYAVNGRLGLESIGFDFGINDVVPIYWKILGDARYTVSPKPFATFTVGAAGVMERYHDEGHGYVYPKSFDYRPLDVVYRERVVATPWSTEWYDPELSSHEFALVRANMGLHGNYLGAWLFAAYYHDFEDSPFAELGVDKVILEPALRFAYRSLVVYAGMNRVVDTDTFDKLKKFKSYNYFVRIGNYDF